MCGICGVAAISGHLDPAIRDALPAMTRMLEHRGPDGEGLFSDTAAALGHRRLAIIDKQGGSQPMANEDRSCWVVFNGEIYNHLAVRCELIERGHDFRTLSDTEVIVHAYEEFGEAAVDRLEGMFAFAVWDTRRRELFIARDRLGKKPLFYGLLDGTLHFASEMKALHASPAWKPELDQSSLEMYLALGYIVAPRTIYRDIKKLEPGHWLRLRDGRIEIRKYWDISRFGDDPRTTTALVQAVESTLARAVGERLESEVPLGAFLSGGIDSGLVVSMMADVMNKELITTSVGFGDPEHNELAAARMTASKYSTTHHESVTEANPTHVLDAVVSAFDEPFADASAIPTYYVSAIARQHVTVALTGDGGDEAFGGYGFRYIPHALECRARSWMPRGGAALARWLGVHWPRSPRLPRILRLGTIWDNLSVDAASAYAADLCMLSPVDARGLLGGPGLRDSRDSEAYAIVTDPYRRCPADDPLLRAQYADLKVYLPNDVLVKVDRMSMANSLEIRSPLLDRKVVELAFAIPSSRKMPRLRPKHLLKEIASRRLPSHVVALPKHGFTAPVSRWILDERTGAFHEDVLSPAARVWSVLDRRRVGAMYEAHRRGTADHSYGLWAVWMLERWMRVGLPRQRVPRLRVIVARPRADRLIHSN